MWVSHALASRVALTLPEEEQYPSDPRSSTQNLPIVRTKSVNSDDPSSILFGVAIQMCCPSSRVVLCCGESYLAQIFRHFKLFRKRMKGKLWGRFFLMLIMINFLWVRKRWVSRKFINFKNEFDFNSSVLRKVAIVISTFCASIWSMDNGLKPGVGMTINCQGKNTRMMESGTHCCTDIFLRAYRVCEEILSSTICQRAWVAPTSQWSTLKQLRFRNRKHEQNCDIEQAC
jgi:hypothetical protein